MRDPERGDYRLVPDSPAAGYGCLGFPGPQAPGVSVAVPPRRSTSVRHGRLDVGGPIAVDTFWAADTVRVFDQVIVLDGITLTVAAGTRVVFQGDHGLAVQGRLLALGEAEARILFRGGRGLSFVHTPETNEPSLLRFCEVTGSTAGALEFIGFSRCRVENSILHHNQAARGGAVFCSHYAQPMLVGCLIHDNEATEAGAALYCLDAQPRLVNCTIVDNRERQPDPIVRAAAITAMLSRPQLSNCIVWDNRTGYFEGLHLVHTKAHDIRYNDVEGGHDGEGNIKADPLLDGLYALTEDSPAIAAGIADTTGLALPNVDLTGDPRLVDGRVDLGCYEFQGVVSNTVDTGVARGLEIAVTPNPFNPSTTIAFDLPQPARVQVTIHDVRGRLLRTLLGGARRPVGGQTVRWGGLDDSGRAAPGGVYLCRIVVDGTAAVRRLVLVR